jgi:hypothetical protein
MDRKVGEDSLNRAVDITRSGSLPVTLSRDSSASASGSQCFISMARGQCMFGWRRPVWDYKPFVGN